MIKLTCRLCWVRNVHISVKKEMVQVTGQDTIKVTGRLHWVRNVPNQKTVQDTVQEAIQGMV